MKKILLYITCSLLSITCFSQVVKQGEQFTKVPVLEEKVIFMKEIPLKSGLSAEDNYKLLKEWAGINYGKDPFISSIRYNLDNKEFIAKSRIELLLPANSKGEREKMIMRYRVNGFIFQDKCVLEIIDISYLYENSGKGNLLSRVIRAEDFITDKALEDNNHLEIKTNTRKSTLYFLNELGANFENKFGYKQE
ncbi:MAG: hypothetical protein LBU84_14570 [Prevotella sp.]|jgi:hypothetical protein|nr:hypothetical protein [Prevotella sp.]